MKNLQYADDESPLLPEKAAAQRSTLRKVLPWIYALGTLVGMSTQYCSLPLWLGAFGASLGSPYIVLLVSSTFYVLVFGVSSLIWWLLSRHPVPSFLRYWKYYVPIGFLNALNGILIVYASPPARTPNILQSFFANCLILWSVPTSKFLLKEKTNYLAWRPLLSLVLIFAGVFVSLTPLIQAVASGQESLASQTSIVWPILFMIAVGPGAIYNVIQQKFLTERDREWLPDKPRHRFFDMNVMLFWGCFFQLMTMLLCFWVDFLPWFGVTTSIEDFWSSLTSAAKCLFQVSDDPGCHMCIAFGILFNGGYVLGYIAGSLLNEESANFNMIAGMFVTPVVTLFWLIFPELNQSSGATPLWAVLPPLALFVAGSVIWKLWEQKEKGTSSAVH